MRKANIHDMFEVVRFIDKLGIREDLFDAQHNIEDLEKIGFEAIFDIIKATTTQNAETEFYKLLSSPFEMKPEEIETMEITVFVNSIKECFNLETLINFIKRVGPMVQ